ncbi:sulfurtransferase [Sulfurospirillum diekertiae]|uniref:ferredoxin-thioredoxin reductase catalytic domain-containing protein n=1 Tax=Sulfurospirillum diekertiae TaxID=1854492 RepID=UPI0014277EED|nr:ferredoxin-thioredoxin reductase catalytic domain-containing protein [Sulfurospirillum diekertiae]QIR79421.1 sulfurtransferase [Sulfurospirillum diekertiae]
MITKIDMNSPEFLAEFEKTEAFTDKVCEQFGFAYTPLDEVKESIQQGLTRNKLIYGKRYCPCFMVIGSTPEEQANAGNRLCPCTPALTVEIPQTGKCHCTIFCTPEHARELAKEENMEEIAHTHTRGLSKEECDALMKKKQIDGNELEALLEARKHGVVNFNLVDTREWMEWISNRITGTDFLIPTTGFHDALSQLSGKENIPVILYCYSGSRSAYCQRILLQMGYKTVLNLEHGIMAYDGECENGE